MKEEKRRRLTPMHSMRLRDYFAMMINMGWQPRVMGASQNQSIKEEARDYAHRAYLFADAMLAERETKENQ